jgi:prephenate dehydrogenase
MFNQLGVIGCGLMGGSFALALKRAGLVKRVVGYSKSPSTTERAKKLGVIDVAAESALLAVSGSDIVLIAVPVAATEATFKAIRHLVRARRAGDGRGQHQARRGRRRAPRAARTRGLLRAGAPDRRQGSLGHPACRRHAVQRPPGDPDAAAADPPELVQKATDVWSAIGTQVLKMTPENHDAAFAAVSHLPHLLAFAYFSAVVNQPLGKDYLSLAGPGFRDFTRIAASDPEMWRDILVANREEVLKQSQRFRHALDALEHVMREGNADALEDLIRGPPRAAAAWQMGAPRVPGGAAGKNRPRQAPKRSRLTPHVRHSPSRPAAAARRGRHGAPARLQEHLQPRAAAGRPGRRHDRRARPAGQRRHARDAGRAARAGLHWLERDGAVLRVTGLGGRLAVHEGRAVPGQCRHGDAPADRRAGRAGRPQGGASRCAACRACTSARSATWSTRCARWAAHRRPRHSRATRRCA